jgi:hypothetical protein
MTNIQPIPAAVAVARSRTQTKESTEATHSIAFLLQLFSFRVFRPKIACQAPKPPKPLKRNKIELAC